MTGAARTTEPTWIVQVSTLYQLANMAALVDAGLLGDDSTRRILVVANNSVAPELTPAAHTMPGATGLLQRFDSVVDWNAAVWPSHPKAFGISTERAPVMERSLRREWNIAEGERLELLVESLPGHPAGALTHIFSGAPISVHSDGLMSYGPLRNPLSYTQSLRLRRIVYTDLLPGITPRQLAEHSPERVVLPPHRLAAVFEEMAAEVRPQLAAAGLDHVLPGSALVLGQYLAQLNLISADEERELHEAMIDEAKARGMHTVVFKPHPTSARTTVGSLRRRCTELGLDFVLADVPVLAEIVIARTRPELVISCYSTGLATASALFGCATAAVGTELLLDTLRPYENSNRIPLTIVDALHHGGYALAGQEREPENPGPGSPEATGSGSGLKDLNPLIDAVTFCMQAESADYLRASAVEFLRTAVGTRDMTYFKRRRLEKLDLPGQGPQRKQQTTLDRAKRVLRTRAQKLRSLARNSSAALEYVRDRAGFKDSTGSKNRAGLKDRTGSKDRTDLKEQR